MMYIWQVALLERKHGVEIVGEIHSNIMHQYVRGTVGNWWANCGVLVCNITQLNMVGNIASYMSLQYFQDEHIGYIGLKDSLEFVLSKKD